MKFNAQLLKELNKNSVVVNDEGNLELPNWIQELTPILQDALMFTKDIPFHEQRSITWGIFKKHALNNTKFSNSSITNYAKELRSEYYKKPLSNYTIATNISLSSYVLKRVFSEAMILFSSTFPRSIEKERTEPYFVEMALNSLHVNKFPDNYACVRVKVKARCEYSAMELGLDSLNLLRGIWNLSKNSQTLMKSTSGNQPINSIILGPVHTLHLESGESVRNSLFWYEPFFLYEASSVPITKSMIAYEKDVRKRLSKLPESYRVKISHFIREYCNALDNVDHHKSFLALWSVLEMVTGTDSYNQVIKRATCSWHDRDYHKQILEGLRGLRNKVVHTNHQLDNIEPRLYQLKRYVEILIELHLTVGLDFKKIEKTWDMMDLEPDKNYLSDKIKFLKTVQSYLKE